MPTGDAHVLKTFPSFHLGKTYHLSVTFVRVFLIMLLCSLFAGRAALNASQRRALQLEADSLYSKLRLATCDYLKQPVTARGNLWLRVTTWDYLGLLVYYL